MRAVEDMKTFLRVEGAGKLLAAMICYGIGTGILAPMNAVYMSDGIGISKGEIASIFAISLLLNMVTTITVGYASDKMTNRKTLPLIAIVLCVVGLLIYMRASNYVTTLIGMCIAVAPSGLIMGQLFAMARNHFTTVASEIVEISQLWLRAGFSVGFFTGLLLGANLFLIATFQGVLWGNLAGYVLLFVLLLFYKEYKGAAPRSSAAGQEPFSLVMLVAILMISCADAIRGLYLPLVVKELFGKPELMSYLWSVQAVLELLFMTITGYWAAKYGSRRIIVWGAASALATYLLYASGGPLIVYFIAQPLNSFFVSILYGVAMGYVQRMFLSRTGFGSSLYVFITQTASLIGYFLPLAVKGFSPLIFFIPSMLVIAALALMGASAYNARTAKEHRSSFS